MFHVKLVVATALKAVVRKVIIIDYTTENVFLIYSIAGMVVKTGIAYWIAADKEHVRPQ